jgi:hypothetical protein
MVGLLLPYAGKPPLLAGEPSLSDTAVIGDACCLQRNLSGGDGPSKTSVTTCTVEGSLHKSHGGGSPNRTVGSLQCIFWGTPTHSKTRGCILDITLDSRHVNLRGNVRSRPREQWDQFSVAIRPGQRWAVAAFVLHHAFYTRGRILRTVEEFGRGLIFRGPTGSTQVRPTETRGPHLDEKRSLAHSSQICPKATADRRCRRSVSGICDTSPSQPQRRHTPRCGRRIGVMLQFKFVTVAPPSCFASRGTGHLVRDLLTISTHIERCPIPVDAYRNQDEAEERPQSSKPGGSSGHIRTARSASGFQKGEK